MNINIAFSVMGVCNQTIELAEDCPLSKQEILDGLNDEGDHMVYTCITAATNNEPHLVLLKNGQFIVLGKVIDCEIDAEYEEFTLEEG